VPQTNNTYAEAEVYLRSWCSKLVDENITATYKIGVGAAADAIIDLADELAIDLVTMSTRGNTAISLWSLGSVAQKVLLGGSTPIMLVKE